jgi:DNA invertase Pin-like site-specific DNA recombinase
MGARMGRLVGYARVSTQEQELGLQVDALKEAGVELLFSDKLGGTSPKRPGLEACLEALTEGDTLLVWKLDRLGRSVVDLVEIVASLKARGVGFRCLRDSAIDTTTPAGELVFHIFAALAQFEREMIRERTLAGLAAARARGIKSGRHAIPSQSPKVQAARRMFDSNAPTYQITQALGISKSTLYRYLRLTEPDP